MNRKRLLVALIGALPFSGTLSLLVGQTPSAGIEQQLRAQYPIARVGYNGTVARAGTLITVQQDGITALPSPGIYPCNSYKPSSRIKHPIVCVANYTLSKEQQRRLQVGETANLTSIEIKSSEIVFRVQTYDAAPYGAAVSFEFTKGYLGSMSAKQIQETIGEVFAVDATPPPPPVVVPVVMPSVTLKLPASYANAQTPTDQISLNADNTLSLQEAGQPYRGTFQVNGNTMKIHIDPDTDTSAAIDGNKITDASGQTWVLREQSAAPAPAEGALRNQDIIQLVKVGLDDATILAKIASSKCQFDTSTDALIQLKQSGVSAAVIRAIVGAAK